jgi:hypothetical protein
MKTMKLFSLTLAIIVAFSGVFPASSSAMMMAPADYCNA